jgi:beta-lactamase regulating signal transducer with metallopeptidase domain
MREHLAPAVYFLEVHLLYASLVCLGAWVLTSAWSAGATRKYWIWVATSFNFIVPLGGFFDRFGASSVSWATQLKGLDDIGIGISRHLTVGGLLLGAWLCGVAFMLARLRRRIRANHHDAAAAAAHSAAELERPMFVHGVPVRISGTGHSPSVDGVLHPYISLPSGIERLLTKPELEAVLIHEVAHAQRRDNLIGLMHEIGLCALWFHPLVWLTGFRLAVFRELSCDDSVIARARGADLLTALAKLAEPTEPQLLRAGATSFFSRRLARLTAPQRRAASRAADSLLLMLFGAVLVAGVLGTIAHTACCFKVRI